MTTTNDAMFVALKALYPSAGETLGDLLYTHWSTVGLQYRGSLQYDYYVAQGADGLTVGDLANSFWSDPDYVVSNLELEDGTDLLLEDGSFMLLEAGNL
jgi:hypothetical protein